jgi:S-DNA-T family DNA segregation ATPase FtsK/SpoIIIE
MGNRLKSPKSKVDEEVLIEEKEETVEIKSIVRDERTHKIIGSILFLK